LAVGKLPPVLDDRRVIPLRKLIEDFADFATSLVDWQLEYLRWLHGGHPGCQIMGANGHVRPPEQELVQSRRSWASKHEIEGAGEGAVPIIPANHRLREPIPAQPVRRTKARFRNHRAIQGSRQAGMANPTPHMLKKR